MTLDRREIATVNRHRMAAGLGPWRYVGDSAVAFVDQPEWIDHFRIRGERLVPVGRPIAYYDAKARRNPEPEARTVTRGGP